VFVFCTRTLVYTVSYFVLFIWYVVYDRRSRDDARGDADHTSGVCVGVRVLYRYSSVYNVLLCDL